MSDSGGSTSKVSFSDDVDVEEAAPVTSRRASDESLEAVKKRVSLSKSAKAWDIDGDGELDDAELALRDMDKTKKGTLSKQQMYSLMQQNINMTGELKKIKKVVIALVALTCVLAAANIGLSFAAAFLAKDTTTSEGKLVDAKTGDTLKTDSTTNRFEMDPEFNKEYNERQRSLVDFTGSYTDVAAVSNADGLAIVAACYAGSTVTIGKVHTAGTVDTQICYPGGPSGSYWPKNSDTKEKVKIGSGPSAIVVQAAGNGGAYEITGLPLSAEGDLCTVEGDCESGLTCDTGKGSVCTYVCPVAIDVDPECLWTLDIQPVCHHNTCQYGNSGEAACAGLSVGDYTNGVCAASF